MRLVEELSYLIEKSNRVGDKKGRSPAKRVLDALKKAGGTLYNYRGIILSVLLLSGMVAYSMRSRSSAGSSFKGSSSSFKGSSSSFKGSSSYAGVKMEMMMMSARYFEGAVSVQYAQMLLKDPNLTIDKFAEGRVFKNLHRIAWKRSVEQMKAESGLSASRLILSDKEKKTYLNLCKGALVGRVVIS